MVVVPHRLVGSTGSSSSLSYRLRRRRRISRSINFTPTFPLSHFPIFPMAYPEEATAAGQGGVLDDFEGLSYGVMPVILTVLALLCTGITSNITLTLKPPFHAACFSSKIILPHPPPCPSAPSLWLSASTIQIQGSKGAGDGKQGQARQGMEGIDSPIALTASDIESYASCLLCTVYCVLCTV